MSVLIPSFYFIIYFLDTYSIAHTAANSTYNPKISLYMVGVCLTYRGVVFHFWDKLDARQTSF